MQDFQQQQAQFAAHLRNPEQHAAPAGVEARRLKIYRELFFNNIEKFISGAFPVLRSLVADADWQILVRDFYATHKAQSPYFLEISEEFLAWLENEQLSIHQSLPFARELAHYEWVELALDVADDSTPAGIDPQGDLLAGVPILSGVAWPLVYHWPVHLIGRDYQPQEPSEQPVCLVVYRNRDDKVEFLEANPLTLRLLEIIAEERRLTGEQVLVQLAQEMQQADVQAIIGFGQAVLQQLHALHIIAGTSSGA